MSTLISLPISSESTRDLSKHASVLLTNSVCVSHISVERRDNNELGIYYSHIPYISFQIAPQARIILNLKCDHLSLHGEQFDCQEMKDVTSLMLSAETSNSLSEAFPNLSTVSVDFTERKHCHLTLGTLPRLTTLILTMDEVIGESSLEATSPQLDNIVFMIPETHSEDYLHKLIKTVWYNPTVNNIKLVSLDNDDLMDQEFVLNPLEFEQLLLKQKNNDEALRLYHNQ